MNDQLRAQFPALARTFSGRSLIYFDSAATSLRPTGVIEAEAEFYRRGGANVHRAKHALSEESSEAFESARETVADHLGASSAREIIFTQNTTHGLNMVATGLKLEKGDEVLQSFAEHHSNLVPWQRAATVRFIEHDPLRPIEPAQLEAALGRQTKVVVLSQASNVTGVVQPIAELCAVARAAGAITVVDAAQSVPHLAIDVGALGCDFLAFSGHKALGPMGIGVLWGREQALQRLEPLALGGGTVDRVERGGYTLRKLPHRLEAGTPNVGGAVALAEALRFLRRLSFEQIGAHAESLAAAMFDGLGAIGAVKLHMAGRAPRLPIATLTLPALSVHADEVALMLSDRYAIMTRSGFHCAHPLFDALGVTGGALRASAHVYNTRAEVETLCYAVRELAAAFAR